ncbi:MAG: transporter substrate-binding domain-containing protein [Colwellia sp.]
MKGLIKNLLVGALLTSCANLVSAENISGATLEWPPFTGEKLQNQGVMVDIVKQAFKTSGHDLVVSIVPWDRAMADTKSRQTDVMIGLWYSDKRAKDYLFSKPFLYNRIVFIKRSDDSFEFNGLEGLKGKKVGVVRNYSYNDAFKATTNFKKPETSNLQSNLKKLAAGRIDLTLEDEIVARYILNEELKQLNNKITLTANALDEKSVHIAISRNNPNAAALIAAFDKGIDVLKANGNYEKIINSHGLN